MYLDKRDVFKKIKGKWECLNNLEEYQHNKM